ncbi:MAG TPA: NAD(P)H-binding protein [Anaerolineales bacterium]|nr:NAD(P)H-binding protein [Anaerolineales bacterium]
MILITGGTGFIGQALIRHLVEARQPVRTLIRPSPRSPNLPRGVPVEVAISSLQDERSLQAALVGVDTIYHLAGSEWRGAYASLMEIDIRGTQAVVKAAVEAGVQRLFFVSHLGADRASAYPVLKAKAIAEEFIRRSGLDYTILRTAIVFGPRDGFTTGLAQLLHALPFAFLLPGDGETLLQPLWVEDLATCLVWALDDESTRNQTYELGGPEHLRFTQVVETIIENLGIRRRLLPMRPPYLRAMTVFLENLLPSLPISVYWLDYLATNRTCALDTLPRFFNLMPARFSQRLAYLKGQNWRREMWRRVLRRRFT